MIRYADRWRLAVATKQALPVPTETGDVMPTEPTSSSSSSSSSGLAFSPSEIKIAFENMAHGAQVLLAVGTGLGIVVGGAIGYAIGKAK